MIRLRARNAIGSGLLPAPARCQAEHGRARAASTEQRSNARTGNHRYRSFCLEAVRSPKRWPGRDSARHALYVSRLCPYRAARVLLGSSTE